MLIFNKAVPSNFSVLASLQQQVLYLNKKRFDIIFVLSVKQGEVKFKFVPKDPITQGRIRAVYILKIVLS